MSDDSSRPALGAVSLCQAFAAWSSRRISFREWHDCVPESMGLTQLWPTDPFSKLGSLAFHRQGIHGPFPIELPTEKKPCVSMREESLHCTPAAELKLWRKSKEPYVVPNLRR